MLKRILYLAATLLLALLALASIAQEEEPACTVEGYQAFAENFGTTTDSALTDVSDNDSGLFYLLILEALIETQRSLCSGRQFNNETYADGVIGPLIFGGTLYQATLSSEGNVTLGNIALEGSCPFVYLYTGTDRREDTDLWRMEDCAMMLELDAFNDSTTWTLVIERLQ